MSKKRRKPAPNRPAAPPKETLVPAPALRNPTVWVGVALAGVTVLVFAAVRHFGFINLDDPGYVRDNVNVNRGFTWQGITWAWTTGYAANWHPLTWLSHMLDAQLFGVSPGWHHMTNVVLHAGNALLLFVLLKRATGALIPSAAVAALFALHPLHVESVAWIAERKDVLSTMLWLLATIAYVNYARAPRWWRYLIVFVLMALGLMAKPMLVSLPLVLLLIDVWPLGRLAQGRMWFALVIEKLPLFALSAASSVVTVLVQRQGGAVTGLDLLPLSTRVANAAVAYVRYLGKMVWPKNLAIFYPYSETLPIWWVAGSVVLLIAISFLAVRAVRHRPYIFVGWFWYVITLAPVIGLVQVGTQAIADRYTYVPLIGIFIALAWGAAELAARRPALRLGIVTVAALAIVACAAITYAQVNVWQSNFTVWSHARDVTQGNYIAENEIGIELVKQDKHDEALPHFEQSSRYKPEFVEAHNNLGLAYSRRGRNQDAIDQFTLTVRLKPNQADAFNSLGFAYQSVGKTDEAMASYASALQTRPEFVEAHNNLGFLLAAAGRVDEAIPHFQAATRLAPDAEQGHMYLGMAFGAAGRLDDALREFREVARVNPGNANAGAQIERLDAAIKKRAAGGR